MYLPGLQDDRKEGAATMRKFPLLLIPWLVAGTASAEVPSLFQAGSGPPNIVPSGRDVCWSEPADLNGLIASSEQILAFGLESEVANDFVVSNTCIAHVTFWGGYYNNSTPCSGGITTPGFNLKFYSDGGCGPVGTTPDVAWIVATTFGETSVGCQQGVYPMFKWDFDLSYNPVIVVQGNVYWFGGQMLDHAFPPQGGRLAAGSVTGCDTVFRSVYFGYPDWTPAIDVFGVAFDCSQEFECYCGICPPWGIDDPNGACCFGSDCRILYPGDCSQQGGHYLGDGVPCDPNPCGSVHTKSTTWGQIKESYR